MSFLPVQAVIFGSLLWASWQDLESHRVSDLVWIVAGFGSLFVSGFLYDPSVVLGMVKQGVILFGIGLAFNYFSSFGMADVIALGFIGLSVPQARALTLASVVLVVAIAYQRIYSRIFQVRAVPLIPGLLIGFVFSVLVL